MEDIIKEALDKDPRALYLQQLGIAIVNITGDPTHFTAGTDRINLRCNWVDNLHKKAMEVINTIDNKNTKNEQ